LRALPFTMESRGPIRMGGGGKMKEEIAEPKYYHASFLQNLSSFVLTFNLSTITMQLR